MIEDIGGRINCANLTPEEWRLLEFAALVDGWWFTPDDAQWAAVRGTLALVEIRRGYEVKDAETVQFGVAQIRLNQHGKNALVYRANGIVYQVGEPMTWEDFERLVEGE